MNERIVCLDIGDVRIGVAVSDPTGTIATPVEVITRVGWTPDIRKIRSVCDRFETNRILSGLPLNMNGSEGFQADKIRAFCEQLTRTGFDVHFQDERLTTVTAEEALIEGNVSRAERKQKVDKVAAAVILQQWLDAQNNKKEEENPMNNERDDEMINPDDEQYALSEGDVIEMLDENGETIRFTFVDALEYEGKTYLALTEPEEDDAVFFLRIDTDEDGSDVYTAPEEELEDRLFEQFLKQREQDDAE